MEEKLITFDTAKLAKEKGFNEPCKWYMKDGIDLSESNETNDFLFEGYLSAPSQSLLHKWLREKHYLTVRVHRDYDGWAYMIEEFKSGNKMIKGGSAEMPDYEVEFEKGLQEALKLIS